jgi:hypothetical protein
MWPRIIFALFLLVILPIVVLTQFKQKQQPTEILNPGTTINDHDDCFSVWCGDEWKKRQ